MFLFEFFAVSGLLFVFFFLLLVPPGQLLLQCSAPSLPRSVQQLAAPGVGALLWSVVAAAGWLGGPSFLHVAALSIVGLCSTLWISARHWRSWLEPEPRRAVLLHLLYFLFVLHFATFPENNLRDTSAASIQRLTGYAIDNLIPYNASRYPLEGIAPAEVEVVPNWAFSDRGPLAGLLNTVVFSLLNLQESAGWLETSPALFFVFEALLVYLNALLLLAVYFVGATISSRQTAALSALLLVTTGFFFSNVLFSWPKCLMAYYVVTAFYVWHRSGSERPGAALTGLLFGGAVLGHEIAVFHLAAFLLWIVCTAAFRSERKPVAAARSLAVTIASAAAVLAPWQLVKMLLYPSSSRLFYLHLFCLRDQSLAGLSAGEAWSRYLAAHSFADFLSIRIGNLIYPFLLTEALPAVTGAGARPYLLLQAAAELARYQLLFALGPAAFLLVVIALAKPDPRIRSLLSFVAIGVLALLPAAALFGCTKSTWNHVWAYVALATATLPAAAAVGGRTEQVLFAAALVYNLTVLLLMMWCSEAGLLYLHASRSFMLAHGALLAALLIVTVRWSRAVD